MRQPPADGRLQAPVKSSTAFKSVEGEASVGKKTVKGRKAVRELEEVLVAQIESKGKVVTYLSDEQRAAFEGPALNVHKSFLLKHPELKPLYAQVRKKLASMR